MNKIEKKRGLFAPKEIVEPIKEDYVGTSLELGKSLIKVKSRIRTDINEDFTLAKFDDSAKDPITEMVHLGFVLKKKVSQIKKKAKIYDYKDDKWHVRGLNEQESLFVDEKANRVFDTILYRLQTSAILNRNKKGNHLIEIISGKRETAESEEKSSILSEEPRK